jgi:uncharacterized protein (DUF58 family)
MTDRSVRLTSRGRALLVAAVAMVVGGVMFGINELYPVALSILVLVTTSRLWLGAKRWDVRVVRHIHPARVPAGSDARVELTVRNVGSRRSPPILAGDPFDGGKRWARFAISPLSPTETRVASYRLPTTRRGVFRLGPLQLEVSDPFGLARATRATTPDTSLTVHPRVEAVSTRSLSALNNSEMRLPKPVIGSGGNEFYGLRTYVTGDDLRHVHWPSTARLDDLVIRQPDNLWRGRITVAADLRDAIHDSDSLEAVLSAVASVAICTLGSGMQVRVVTTGGMDTGYVTSSQQGSTVLDLLAGATTSTNDSLAQSLRLVRDGTTLVLCTTDACQEKDLAAALRLGGSSASVVVFDRRAGVPASGLAAVPGRSRLVRVPLGESFRAAWEGVSC